MKHVNTTLLRLIISAFGVGVCLFFIPKFLIDFTNPIYMNWAESNSFCTAGMAGILCSLSYFSVILTVYLIIFIIGFFTMFLSINKKLEGLMPLQITVITGVLILALTGFLLSAGLNFSLYTIFTIPAVSTVIYILIGRRKHI